MHKVSLLKNNLIADHSMYGVLMRDGGQLKELWLIEKNVRARGEGKINNKTMNSYLDPAVLESTVSKDWLKSRLMFYEYKKKLLILVLHMIRTSKSRILHDHWSSEEQHSPYDVLSGSHVQPSLKHQGVGLIHIPVNICATDLSHLKRRNERGTRISVNQTNREIILLSDSDDLGLK